MAERTAGPYVAPANTEVPATTTTTVRATDTSANGAGRPGAVLGTEVEAPAADSSVNGAERPGALLGAELEATSPAGSLPRTGSSNTAPLAATAAGLLAAGAAFVAAGRRRSA